jgi:hypothetical protein
MRARAYLFEVVQVPFVVFTWPVSGKVGGCLVAHDLGADLKLLHGQSVKVQQQSVHRKHAFLCASTVASGLVIFAWLRLVYVSLVGSSFLELF